MDSGFAGYKAPKVYSRDPRPVVDNIKKTMIMINKTLYRLCVFKAGKLLLLIIKKVSLYKQLIAIISVHEGNALGRTEFSA